MSESSSERIVGSAREIADVFAASMIPQLNGLMANLRGEVGLVQEAPDYAQSLNFLFECVAYIWWVFDILLHRELSPEVAEAIRTPMKELTLNELQRVGFRNDERHILEELLRSRFLEYTECMCTQEKGGAMLQLGTQAWHNIIGDQMTQRNAGVFLIATRATAVWSAFRGIGRRVTIIHHD